MLQAELGEWCWLGVLARSPGCENMSPSLVAIAAWGHDPSHVLQAGCGHFSAALLGQVLPLTLPCPVVLQIPVAQHRDC